MYNDQQPNPGSWQEEEQRMTLPPKRGNGFSTASIYAAVTVYQNFPELIQQYQQLYEMYQGGM